MRGIDTIKKNTGSSELDIRLKNFGRDNTHFADLVNAVVFGGEEVVQPDMLLEADTDFSGIISFPEYDEALKRIHDIVKKCSLGMEFIVFAVEDQSRVQSDRKGGDCRYVQSIRRFRKKRC